MSSKDSFKQTLGCKLRQVKAPEADDTMWQVISAHIKPEVKKGTWYWHGAGIAASVFIALLLLKTPTSLERVPTSARISTELYFMDIELQRAVLNEAQTTDVSRLMKQRTSIVLQQSERYEL